MQPLQAERNGGAQIESGQTGLALDIADEMLRRFSDTTEPELQQWVARRVTVPRDGALQTYLDLRHETQEEHLTSSFGVCCSWLCGICALGSWSRRSWCFGGFRRRFGR